MRCFFPTYLHPDAAGVCVSGEELIFLKHTRTYMYMYIILTEKNEIAANRRQIHARARAGGRVRVCVWCLFFFLSLMLSYRFNVPSEILR